ncbi:hypothetical protein KUTeg_000932 [Tegillarca granosa]|uniref:HTH psq-type domain-containing protein n=1 Tax=Tegillarca granosa TaxID=220873 RepID=A0ABQ9FZ39_TEGGR|nr:hypothetical protein KUTeg_000932 [Tegillarca granosa]
MFHLQIIVLRNEMTFIRDNPFSGSFLFLSYYATNKSDDVINQKPDSSTLEKSDAFKRVGYRNYSAESLTSAYIEVNDGLLTEAKAARKYNIPDQTLREVYKSYNRADVLDIATDYAVQLGLRPSDKPLSYKWFYGLLDRWPKDLKVWRPKTISDLRAKTTSRESISKYFEELHKILE